MNDLGKGYYTGALGNIWYRLTSAKLGIYDLHDMGGIDGETAAAATGALEKVIGIVDAQLAEFEREAGTR